MGYCCTSKQACGMLRGDTAFRYTFSIKRDDLIQLAITHKITFISFDRLYQEFQQCALALPFVARHGRASIDCACQINQPIKLAKLLIA